MKSFFAIVKLTCRNAFRSHIFQLLLAILVLCVVFIPATIEGDGTVRGFIQVSLKFSLFAVGLMLSLSAIWSSCMTMTQDVDGYQLHMVITKPVSRVKVWLAKWTGIFSIHFVLLIISSVLVYGVVMYRYNSQLVPEGDISRVQTEISSLEAQISTMPNNKERDYFVQRLDEQKDVLRDLNKRVAEDERIRNEVLVARRSFVPVDQIVDQEGNVLELPIDTSDYITGKTMEKFRTTLADNKLKGVIWSSGTQRERLKDMKIQTLTEVSIAGFGEANRKAWRFVQLPTSEDNPLYLRFRMFVTKVSDHTERDTMGWWFYGRVAPGGEEGSTIALNSNWIPLTDSPQLYRTNNFIEIQLPADAVDSNGTMYLSFINLDSQKEDLFFQVWDGPRVYAEFGGFTANYIKSVFIIILQLLLLCGLGCAVAGFMSMPTAIFFVITYLLFGTLSTMITSENYIISDDAGVTARAEFGAMVGEVLLTLIIPLQKFDVSGMIADGIMVEWSFIWHILLHYFTFRGVPLFMLGIYLYKRREMGLVIRK